jgi:AmmeMemoRadiSam system protein B/AmmeMemoRadiSam system protein A
MELPLMSHVRPAAVAGMFYPAGKMELDRMVGAFLSDAAGRRRDSPVPKAIIAPHAGYIYSGPIAASAYAQLLDAAERVRRIVLVGPCHRVALRGLAVPSADGFATPLGIVPVDRAAITLLRNLPQVSEFDATHAPEHSLEVHLPFLQKIFRAFSIVPIVVGDATGEDVAVVLERLWGGPETLFVVSSDLSHYKPYEACRRIDATTAAAIERLDADAIGYDQACGRIPVTGLLALAKRKGLKAITLDLRNSGDTAGDRSSVVGYGAWMFIQPGENATGDAPDANQLGVDAATTATNGVLPRFGSTLLHVAAGSIEYGLRTGQSLPLSLADYPAELRAFGASFVTLKLHGNLRGCIGSAVAFQFLVVDVARNGFGAAFIDDRFPKLKREELPAMDVAVSVLTPPQQLTFADEAELIDQLRPGLDGLIIQSRGHRGLFLPQVWNHAQTAVHFVGELKRKAGFPRDYWASDLCVWRFAAATVSSNVRLGGESLWGALH